MKKIMIIGFSFIFLNSNKVSCMENKVNVAKKPIHISSRVRWAPYKIPLYLKKSEERQGRKINLSKINDELKRIEIAEFLATLNDFQPKTSPNKYKRNSTLRWHYIYPKNGSKTFDSKEIAQFLFGSEANLDAADKPDKKR